MEAVQNVLQNCTIEGNIVKLPAGDLERKLYLQVAKALNLIGGKWKGHKVMGFVFQEDPTELLKQIANGEKRNIKKEYQFFETPLALIESIIWLANIKDLKIGSRILEPSAGQGAIVKVLLDYPNIKQVDYCEIMEVNRMFLQKIDSAFCVADDFLEMNKRGYFTDYYDRIIANPPFAKNQDIDHIRKMYECLKPGGRLVSIVSEHWQFVGNKKETDFREWIKDISAEIKRIPKGTFKESGTMVGGLIIIIDKKKGGLEDGK